MADEASDGPFDGTTAVDSAEMQPEALEALRMLDEVMGSLELELAESPGAEEPEVLASLSKDDQQDRIEYRGKKALEGIAEIADYLNPVHATDGAAPKPQPLLALMKVAGLIYREVWAQRSRFATIERTLARQADEIRTLSIDVGSLTNLLHADEAEI